MIIQILGIFLFIGLGIMFLKGKGGSLLIYNGLSHNAGDSHSETGDEDLLEKKVCRFAAVVCFIISIALGKYTIGNLSEITWLITSSSVLLAGTVLIMLLSLFQGSLIKK